MILTTVQASKTKSVQLKDNKSHQIIHISESELQTMMTSKHTALGDEVDIQ